MEPTKGSSTDDMDIMSCHVMKEELSQKDEEIQERKKQKK